MKEEIAKHVSSVLEENEVENRKLEFAKSGRKDDEPQFMIADNYEEESAYGY